MNSKLLHVFILLLFILPVVASAQFSPMVGIPGVDPEAQTVGAYINALYTLSISIAAFLAVIKLIIAGAKYIMTDVITNKESAKKDIRSALIGLLIVLAAALILQTINPNLRIFSIFDDGLDCTEAQGCGPAPTGTSASSGVAPVINSDPNTGLDTIENFNQLSQAERQRIMQECRSGPNPGTFVVVGGLATCQGASPTSASDNIANNQADIAAYLATADLSQTERQNFVRDYNLYIASQEPDGLTESDLRQIRDNNDASAVVFVVSPSTGNSSLTGYEASQERICNDMTGSNNFIVDQTTGYGVCLR